MTSVRSLGYCFFPGMTVPAGDVVVAAPMGVAEERWIPVFMYASLL